MTYRLAVMLRHQVAVAAMLWVKVLLLMVQLKAGAGGLQDKLEGVTVQSFHRDLRRTVQRG